MSNNLVPATVREVLQDEVSQSLAALRGDVTDITGSAIEGIRFVTGLATLPTTLPRRGFGLAAQLVVPPGTWAVTHMPGGERHVYEPGSYWLFSRQPGAILVQFIDARRQQLPIGPIEGWSADKWRVRLWMIADVEVADPVRIAAHREPLMALLAAIRTGALCYIERHTHAALTGCDGNMGGLDIPATELLERLHTDPALEGLRIINIRIVERQGDERQIEAATAATVTAAQIDEELRVAAARQRARLHELEGTATIREREHALRLAGAAADAREKLLIQQNEVQQATLAARVEIVMAQIRAQTAEIARDEQIWQAEQMRLQIDWERVQRQQYGSHQTDQHIRLLDVQHDMLQTQADLALSAEDQRNSHGLAMAEIQARIAEQRVALSREQSDRHAQHERTLLELNLRHDQLVSEQMQQLERWRIEQVSSEKQDRHQHERQLAVIAGTAQIAAAAAQITDGNQPTDRSQVANLGLHSLQELA